MQVDLLTLSAAITSSNNSNSETLTMHIVKSVVKDKQVSRTITAGRLWQPNSISTQFKHVWLGAASVAIKVAEQGSSQHSGLLLQYVVPCSEVEPAANSGGTHTG
jgi:hypothetical protein